MDSLFQRLLDVSSHSLTKYISAFVILGRERTQGNCFPHVLSSFDFVLDSMSFCSFSLSFSRFTLTFYFASKKCCKWMRTNHRRMKWIKSSCQEEEDEEEKEKRERERYEERTVQSSSHSQQNCNEGRETKRRFKRCMRPFISRDLSLSLLLFVVSWMNLLPKLQSLDTTIKKFFEAQIFFSFAF